MKKAKIYIATCYIECPYCKKTISNSETGSHLWHIDEVQLNIHKIFTCLECNKKFELKSIIKNRL